MADNDDRAEEQPREESDTAGDAEPRAAAGADIPVIGVGASAGGLAVYRRLLAEMPNDPGFAMVFLQHLDPDHQSMMADLLDRHTSLTVLEARDGLRVERDHVYMIPPNKFLRLDDGAFVLDDPIKKRGTRMPIDYFFRSLAETKREKAICIILSGTGTDGTQGLREVKAAGGLAIVQDPRDAEYDGMPRSAIGTGLADMILPVEEMPRAVLDYVRHPFLKRRGTEPGLSTTDPEAFRSILNLLQAQTEIDFRCYKTGTLERRIHRRMSLKYLTDPAEYLKVLREEPAELKALFRDLFIGVTHFFRDAQVWDSLHQHVIARLVSERKSGEPIRVWVPGCSSGEEAYTIAMLFFEEFERQDRPFALQIYATDLDEDAIEAARAARYPDSIAADLSKERLDKFFTAREHSYKVVKRVREAIVFACQNLIGDPPFSKIDLISCRNVLIYLDNAVQQRILEGFHFSLRPGGVLLLGTSESTEKSAGLFAPLPGVERGYSAIATTKAPTRATFPVAGTSDYRRKPAARQTGQTDYRERAAAERARSVLLDAFAPASALIDRRFNIQYMHGPLRNYLDFPRGEPVNDLPALALEGLRSRLRGALNRALQENETVVETAHRVQRDGRHVSVRIRVQPIPQRSSRESPLLVSFTDEPEQPKAGTPSEASGRAAEEGSDWVEQLEFEIQAVREDYQTAVQELETSNEELRVSNEETMSMNEELQSTNEELETSREELQSLNEELSTLNSQLQEQLREIESANNDLTNLLSSTDIATLFLDVRLRIRRYTPTVSQLLSVLETDVGRPISDLAPRFADPDLAEDCRQTLDDLQPREADLDDGDGMHYLRRVRPYRTSDNRIEGIVITYADVTRLHDTAERAMQRERQQAAVADLGQLALASNDLPSTFRRAVTVLAAQLDCSHAKILDIDREKDDFVLRGAYGFDKAEIGETRVPGGLASQAGFTLRSGHPVIVEDVGRETRFATSALLAGSGIVSGMSVPLGTREEPWGVLCVHDTKARNFGDDDLAFVRSVATILTAAYRQTGTLNRQRELLERMETVLEAAQLGTWVWDLESDSSVWDERLYELTRFPPETEATGAAFFEAIHPDDRDRVAAAAQGSMDRNDYFQAEFRFLRGDGTWTWLGGLGRTMTDAAGRRRIFGVNFDIAERKLAEGRLRATEKRRDLALAAAALGTWEWQLGSEEMIWDERMFELCGMVPDGPVAIADFEDRVHPDDRASRQATIRGVTREGDTFRNEFRVSRNGEERWLESRGQMIRGGDGELRLVATVQDVTTRKRHEERQLLLMAELDHRVKNILANVNAIARHTASSRPEPEEFLTALEGRLSAMSDAHSLLSVSQWVGVELLSLLEAELSPYVSDDFGSSKRIRVEGPSVILSPQAAQTLCLFLHELVTNAAKHGALKVPGGTIAIGWAKTEAGGFEFEWLETLPDPIEGPGHRGFGLSVIEDMTAADLDARVSLEFREHGLRCRLETADGNIFAAPGKDSIDHLLAKQRPTRLRTDAQEPPRTAELKVLVVEDSWTIAQHLISLIEYMGCKPIGPASRLEEALALADLEGIDAAVLDIRLDTELVFPVAERLRERQVPFAFATGYADSRIVPEKFSDVTIISKPYTAKMVAAAIDRLNRERSS